MDLQTINQELNKRFAEPLPEFYKRRIVIWYDEEGEFADQIDDLVLLNAKVLRLTKTNNFAIKKTIARASQASRPSSSATWRTPTR